MNIKPLKELIAASREILDNNVVGGFIKSRCHYGINDPDSCPNCQKVFRFERAINLAKFEYGIREVESNEERVWLAVSLNGRASNANDFFLTHKGWSNTVAFNYDDRYLDSHPGAAVKYFDSKEEAEQAIEDNPIPSDLHKPFAGIWYKVRE